MLKYFFHVRKKPGLATHLCNLDAIRTAVYIVRVKPFYPKIRRQHKEDFE